MTKTICDHCRKDAGGVVMRLNGVGYHRNNAGIMLPDAAMSHEFCSPGCFWDWALDQLTKANVVTRIVPRMD